MSKKYKKIFRKKDKLRVRKSYYTFTQEYPKYIEVEKTGRRITPKTLRKAAVYCALFFAVACISFFAVKLAINISYAPIDPQQEVTQEENLNEQITAQGVKALYMPYEKLGDEEYIKDFIKEIKKKNGNSAVIDFKTAEGRLCYSSMQDNAIMASAALYDNDTVRKALSLFKDADISVIARVFCFSDSRVANANGDVAVKYMGTDVNWLDGSDENGGKAWLNPYSKSVRNYLAGVVSEISSFGVGVFILEDLQFPGGENASSATYEGEKNSNQRNSVLMNTLSKITASLPEDALVIVSQTATDATEGNENIYYGSLSTGKYYGIAVDTSDRPLGVAVDKKTDYVSVLSMYTAVAGRFQGKTVIPVIDMSEYSASYLRAMKKIGIESFILYNENGEY
ncbi:MAG: hypothetical protein J6V06_09155 [Clostridia bacterium]|nr:hypothetical protein [Clostridia bacterium]